MKYTRTVICYGPMQKSDPCITHRLTRHTEPRHENRNAHNAQTNGKPDKARRSAAARAGSHPTGHPAPRGGPTGPRARARCNAAGPPSHRGAGSISSRPGLAIDPCAILPFTPTNVSRLVPRLRPRLSAPHSAPVGQSAPNPQTHRPRAVHDLGGRDFIHRPQTGTHTHHSTHTHTHTLTRKRLAKAKQSPYHFSRPQLMHAGARPNGRQHRSIVP